MTDAAAAPTRARWLYALKPASWPKLLVPMLLGQALGIAAVGRVTAPGVVVGAVFTLAGLGFIVLLNDWGDRDIDTLKRRMLPDAGSPKTIPDRILPSRQVLIGGIASGAVALTIAFVGGPAIGRPWLGPMSILGMCLFLAYTMPPIRLNYRGGGELLEMTGVGLVLPWINAYAQSNALLPNGAAVLPGFVLLARASAIASGLSDELSDREGGKTTVVTVFGNEAGRRFTERAVLAGAIAWLCAPALPGGPPAWVVVAPLAAVAWGYRGMRARSAHATTRAFVEQKRYKASLHHAIWGGGTLLAVGLVAARLLPG